MYKQTTYSYFRKPILRAISRNDCRHSQISYVPTNSYSRPVSRPTLVRAVGILVGQRSAFCLSSRSNDCRRRLPTDRQSEPAQRVWSFGLLANSLTPPFSNFLRTVLWPFWLCWFVRWTDLYCPWTVNRGREVSHGVFWVVGRTVFKKKMFLTEDRETDSSGFCQNVSRKMHNAEVFVLRPRCPRTALVFIRADTGDRSGL